MHSLADSTIEMSAETPTDAPGDAALATPISTSRIRATTLRRARVDGGDLWFDRQRTTRDLHEAPLAALHVDAVTPRVVDGEERGAVRIGDGPTMSAAT
jgi:hypothetical protein